MKELGYPKSLPERLFSFVKWMFLLIIFAIIALSTYFYVSTNSSDFAVHHAAIECRLAQTEPSSLRQEYLSKRPNSEVIFGELRKDWISGKMNLQWAEGDGTSETGFEDHVHVMEVAPLTYSSYNYAERTTRKISRETLQYSLSFPPGDRFKDGATFIRQCNEISRDILEDKLQEYRGMTKAKQKI